jgi:hypothetical protein
VHAIALPVDDNINELATIRLIKDLNFFIAKLLRKVTNQDQELIFLER